VLGSGENGARRLRREDLISSERGREAMHAAFYVIHSCCEDKDLECNEQRDKKGEVRLFCGMSYSFPGYFTYSFADFCVKRNRWPHNDRQNVMVTGRRKDEG
jgi:hypothetical protein